MKNIHSNKRYVIMCIVFVGALIVAIFSFSYAYMQTNIYGDLTETTIKTGTFDIKTTLTNTSGINATNMMLINEKEIEEKAKNITFTVQAASTTNNPGKFNIFLKDIVISKGLININFKWQLLMDDKIIGNGSFDDIEVNGMQSTNNTNTETVNYYDTYYLKEAISFDNFNESTLELRIYLLNDDSVNQKELLNGIFKCKVGIEGYSTN